MSGKNVKKNTAATLTANAEFTKMWPGQETTIKLTSLLQLGRNVNKLYTVSIITTRTLTGRLSSSFHDLEDELYNDLQKDLHLYLARSIYHD